MRRLVGHEAIGAVYDDTISELYKTNLYGGTDADVGTTEKYTSSVDVRQKSGANVQFKFDASGNTDKLVLSLYKRIDDVWDGDEVSVWSQEVDNDGAETIFPFTLDIDDYGPGFFRFGMVSAGVADTFDIIVESNTWVKLNVMT